MTTTPQWIAAVGSVLGAIATTVAVIVAYLGLRGELRRANEERELAHRERSDREAAQARLVLVRLDVGLPPGPNPAVITGTHPRGDVAVLLDNQSPHPVLDARVEQVTVQTYSGPTPVDFAEPAQSWRLDPGWDQGNDPIPGGGGRNWHIVIDSGAPLERHLVDERDRFEVTVVFTDAAGLRWKRTGTNDRGTTQPVPDLRPADPAEGPATTDALRRRRWRIMGASRDRGRWAFPGPARGARRGGR